ncbi:MAG: hypothetical protein QM733_18540 [Ilumatobacteraceae bacterium]
MPQKITRDDIEAGIRQLQGGARQKVADKKKTIATAAGLAAFAALLLTFLLGKRAGKKRSALIEIRRL